MNQMNSQMVIKRCHPKMAVATIESGVVIDKDEEIDQHEDHGDEEKDVPHLNINDEGDRGGTSIDHDNEVYVGKCCPYVMYRTFPCCNGRKIVREKTCSFWTFWDKLRFWGSR